MFFVPGKSLQNHRVAFTRPQANPAHCTVIYFFWPETARLTLEEIAQNFGEEVAVHLTDATDEEKAQLDRKLVEKGGDISETVQASPIDEQ